MEGSTAAPAPISVPEAMGYMLSSDIEKITYASPITATADTKIPRGDITTLLDLANRDLLENDLFPINTGTTWFARDVERRLLPFTPHIQ